MAPGDFVVYLADPLLYGKLWIVRLNGDGRLECEQLHADRNGDFGRDLFDPHELELAATWVPQVPETIPRFERTA